MRELGVLIREIHAIPVEGLETIDSHWPTFIETQLKNCIARQQETGLPEKLLKRLPDYLQNAQQDLPQFIKPVLLTGEYTPMNLLVKQIDGVWHISGLIDFGDCMLGLMVFEKIDGQHVVEARF